MSELRPSAASYLKNLPFLLSYPLLSVSESVASSIPFLASVQVKVPAGAKGKASK